MKKLRNNFKRDRNKNNGFRTMSINLKRENETDTTDDRTIELSFSSENPVERWFGNEILGHSVDNVDLSRINELGVLLFNHDRDKVIGKVVNAWVDEDEKRGKAIVRFDSDEESEKIYQKVKNETLRGVSVGYSVDEWEEVRQGKISSDGNFEGPCEVATRWSPNEISIVSVPADDCVGIGRSFDNTRAKEEEEDSDIDEEEKSEEEDNQDDSKKSKDDSKDADEEKEEDDKEERAMHSKSNKSSNTRSIEEKERKRSAEIISLCRDFEVDPLDFIQRGLSVNQVRTNILDEMRQRNKPLGGARVQVTKDSNDKFRSAASDAILMRSGTQVEKVSEGARDLRGLRLRDLAIECLKMDGHTDALRYSDDKLYRDALTPGSNFASIMDNTVNKSMQTAYNAQVTTYQDWVSIGSNPDFKATTKYQISEAGDLKLIPENGEFEQDEMKDVGVSTKLLTYGKGFSMSRQALINDDIQVITKLPAAYVRAAGRGINKAVYEILSKNQKIYDGKNLFDGINHNNIATTDSGISVVSVGEARRAMRSQKNLRGKETLNISPKFMIVPAALETQAEQFLNSISDPAYANPNVVNPFKSKLQLIVDPELDISSESSWYLAAGQGDCETIEVTYLNGSSLPTLESSISFDNLGMKWRIFIDYGITVIDYRGLYKNKGLSK